MSTDPRHPAPLFTDAFTLCEWLLERLGRDASILARHICDAALALLRSLTLALKGREREYHVDLADDQLVALRLYVQLAGTVELLTEAQSLHALGLLDGIGRQIGGWQRSWLEA